MSQLPVIKTVPVEENRTTVTDVIEAGEQIFQDLQKILGRNGSTSVTQPIEQPEPDSNEKNKNGQTVFRLTGSAVLLVASAMLSKRFLF